MTITPIETIKLPGGFTTYQYTDPLSGRVAMRKIDNNLWIGNHTARRVCPDGFAVLSLCHSRKGKNIKFTNNVYHWSRPQSDYEPISSHMLAAFNTWIDNRHAENKKVLVHCVAGMNRSVQVILNYTRWNLDTLRAVWPIASPKYGRYAVAPGNDTYVPAKVQQKIAEAKAKAGARRNAILI